MLSVPPNVCIAGADTFLGQRLLAYLATHKDSIASLGCTYDSRHPESFSTFFEHCDAFADPEAKLGVSAMGVDYTNPTALAACMMGFDCCVICLPDADPALVRQFCDAVLKACKAAKVCQVVCMSAMGCESAHAATNGAGAGLTNDRETWQGVDPAVLGCRFVCEQACRRAYPDCPIVRCAFLQQWFAGWFDTIAAEGRFKACWGPAGRGPMCPVNADDVARCCAEMLASGGLENRGSGSNQWNVSDRFRGCVLSLTGPEALDAAAVANSLKWANDKRMCAYQPCTVDELRAMLGKFSPQPSMGGGKWSPFATEMCVAMCRAAACNELGGVCEDLEEVCEESCTLEAWCAEECAGPCSGSGC